MRSWWLPLAIGLGIFVVAWAGHSSLPAIPNPAAEHWSLHWPSFVGDLHLIWSVTVCFVLFGSMGTLVAFAIVRDRWIRRELTPKVAVDLLDLAPLAAFGRSGLEACGFWFAGSSVASLLFISFPFSLLNAAILTVTVAMGTGALLRPMQGVHRRIEDAREAELTRVRSEIRAAREPGGATEQMPGLLAWEARIAAISSWPFDTGGALRFGALGAMAMGSWLGGALIERALESTLGN